MSKSYLILGAGGQLGMALQARFPEARALGSDELDITDPVAVESFDWSSFNVILNAAAYTNVDGAETSEGRRSSWSINACGVALLSQAATKHDLTLVHVSSDYVFDGTLSPHREDEPFTPLSNYGASKAAGDVAALCTPKHYILRTTWVVGEGKNFVRTMIGLAEKGISPTVVADQIGRLTFADELASAIDHLLTTTAEFGTYNVTNDGTPASWADITREIFSLSGHDELSVTDTTTEEYFAGKEGIAPRPLQSELALDKLQRTGFTSRDWRDELKEYIDKEKRS